MKHIGIRGVLCIFCCILALHPTAHAETTATRNPFRVQTRGLANVTSHLPSAIKTGATANLRLSLFVPRLGRVQFHFDRFRSLEIEPSFTTEKALIPDLQAIRMLKGSVKLKSAESFAAASIYYVGKTPHLYVSFLGRTARRKRARYYTVDVSLNDSKLGRIRRNRLTSNGLHCSGALDSEQSKVMDVFFDKPRTNKRMQTNTLELSLEGDKSWFERFANSSSLPEEEGNPDQPQNPANLVILQHVNAAEAIYEAQLGLTFNIRRLNTYSSTSFGSGTAQDVLINYQFFAAFEPFFDSADAHFLFTDQDLGSSTGQAFFASVCKVPFNSVGLVRYSNDAHTPITLAHELGHSLGARHDDSLPTSIMSGSVDTSAAPPEVFSSSSIDAISAYIASTETLEGGSCLNKVNPEPSSTPNPSPNPSTTPVPGTRSVSLQITLSNKGDFNAVVNVDQNSVGCQVNLHNGGSEGEVFQSAGFFTFTPTAAGTNLVTKFARKASTKSKSKKNKKKKKGKKKKKTRSQKAFIGAQLTCVDGSSARSEIVRIKPEKIKFKKKALPLTKWLKKVAQKLAGGTK